MWRAASPHHLVKQPHDALGGRHDGDRAATHPTGSSFDKHEHFENGMLFPTVPSYTSAGLRNPFTVWQMVISDDFTLGSSPISFRRPIAYGTHFIGLTTEFDSITTTSFQ
jgi:hypothetical protein